jgi:hypothetical protein
LLDNGCYRYETGERGSLWDPCDSYVMQQ